MRPLWVVLKLLLVLALIIPVSIIALATALGIFGALMGLAFLALRIAVAGLVIWGIYRVAKALFGGSSRKPVSPDIGYLPPPDPHYEAAMRELDRDLGVSK
jgi:uncharacterized Tic20 family protein